METIKTYMAKEHELCNTLFFKIHQYIIEEKWSLAKNIFSKFFLEINTHIKNEETILFPKLKKCINASNILISIINNEHTKIKKLLHNINYQINNKKKLAFFTIYNKTIIILKIHSIKEEQIFYPMLDNKFSKELLELIIKVNNNKKNCS
jgi:iron-sulfur cluster repair protein YtfE (RIC family)